MRRLIVVLAVAAVLVAGVVAAIVIHRLQSQPDIRGSSTEEFTLPTTTAAPKPPSVPGIQWSQYGYDAEHSRSVSVGLAPPFRKVWWYGAGSLVEFPPVVGYGRIYFSTNSGKFAAVSLKTGKRAWRYFSHRCVAASPALGTQQHGTVYAVFLNRPPCNAKKGDGRVIAFSAGLGRIRWQKKIGPSETSPVIDGNRLYVGDWNGSVWALDARSGALGRTAVRGLLRRPRLLPRGGDRPRDLEGVGPVAPLRQGAVLLDADARLRARLHRLHRRPRLLVRRDDREAHLVPPDRQLRLRVARRVERARVRRLLRQALLRVRRCDRRRPLVVPRERPDLG